MPRFQLVELEDLPWFPAAVREGMMDCLRFFFTRIRVYDSSAMILCRLLRQSGQHQVLDLCSGGGGGIVQVVRHLRQHCQPDATVTLSDLYPNPATYQYLREQTQGSLDYLPQPVNALQVPEGLPVVRSLFTAFHHFNPEQAQALLREAVRQRLYLGIFEGTARHWSNFLLVLPLPLLVWLATPFIRPFTFRRLFWTYVVPAIPLGVFWDGLVSMLRLYSEAELRHMTRAASAPGYHWEVQRERHWLDVKTVAVVGYPIKN